MRFLEKPATVSCVVDSYIQRLKAIEQTPEGEEARKEKAARQRADRICHFLIAAPFVWFAVRILLQVVFGI